MSIFQRRNCIFVLFWGRFWHLLFQTYFSILCRPYCNSAVCYRSICNKIYEVNPGNRKYVAESISIYWQPLEDLITQCGENLLGSVRLSRFLFHVSVFCPVSAVCLNPNDPHVSHLHLVCLLLYLNPSLCRSCARQPTFILVFIVVFGL